MAGSPAGTSSGFDTPSFLISEKMLNLIRNVFAFVLLVVSLSVNSQESRPLSEGALHCLTCHGNQTYTLQNPWTGQEEKRLMNPYFIIDTTHYRTGVHRTFSCTDCHATDYETYPHAAELKLEPLSTCLDCHGGDDTYAKYQFERIDEEFQKSVHFVKSGESFTCSKCHNQHYYKPTARNSSTVSEIVSYNNAMCLSCHNNLARFQLVSDQQNPVLAQVHAWLPNQELHFRNVRCIECHTQVTDTLMVSHNILSKEHAVQKCVECHSSNSMLKASLYKYQNLQARSGKGALGAVLQNESYLIGANQVPALKLLSILIFVAALAGVLLHSVFRFTKK